MRGTDPIKSSWVYPNFQKDYKIFVIKIIYFNLYFYLRQAANLNVCGLSDFKRIFLRGIYIYIIYIF